MTFDYINPEDEEDEVKEFTGTLPKYIDAGHPAVAVAGTRILRKSLAKAELHAVSVADLWDVFSSHVQTYQYGQFTDTLAAEMMTDLRTAIYSEYRTEIIAELRVQLRRDLKADLAESITDELTEEIRNEREADVRLAVDSELKDEMTKDLRARLIIEMGPKIEAELRAELMLNDEFVADAKREIQRKALGL